MTVSSEGVIPPHDANDTYLYEDTGHGSYDDGNTSHHETHGVHVISWNLEYVAQPLIVSIFIVAAGALKLVFHYASFLSSIIPESCLLIVVGTIFGAILNALALVPEFHMEPRMFMLFLLPPIVLDAAYSLNDRVFFEHIGTILTFAVLGTILNFFMLGPTLYGLANCGAMGPLDISLVECLLFSSFIVAVDPVAVLAIFQEVGVNNVLYFLVFGESLLNDAVTVVLSNMMKVFVDMETIPVSEYFMGLASFFTVSLGGLTIGILYGALTALFTKHTSHVRVVEPLAVLMFAYLSYLTAELVHWSGIIAMIGCGLVQAEYAFHNISRKSYITVKYFIKMISSANDAIIFLFLGIELVTTRHQWHTGFVLWSMFYCLVFRFIVTFGLSFFVNRRNKIRPINFEEQFIMWYGGLRGAVCFALCDTIRDDFRHKDMFLTTTLFVILVTVFLQGSTIKPLVTLCRIRKKADDAELMFEEINSRVSDHMMTGIEMVTDHYGSNQLREWLVWFNDRFVTRCLQKDPLKEDEKILKCYGKMVMKDYEDNINKAFLHPIQDEKEEAKSQFYLPHEDDKQLIPPMESEYAISMPDRQRQSESETQPNGDMDTTRSPVLRQRQKHAHKKRHSIADAILGHKTVNFEDPTVADIKALLNHSGLSATGLHQKYDRNLINDDDRGIEHHLEEKRRRLARMRRMTLRQQFSVDSGSPGGLRRVLSDDDKASIPPITPQTSPALTARTPPSPNLHSQPHAHTDSFQLEDEHPQTGDKPKPKPRMYLNKEDSEKAQRMVLLHDQAAVDAESPTCTDDSDNDTNI